MSAAEEFITFNQFTSSHKIDFILRGVSYCFIDLYLLGGSKLGDIIFSWRRI